jgi:hypothetical protein
LREFAALLLSSVRCQPTLLALLLVELGASSRVCQVDQQLFLQHTSGLRAKKIA